MRHECNFLKVETRKPNQEQRRHKDRHNAKQKVDRDSFEEQDEDYERWVKEEVE